MKKLQRTLFWSIAILIPRELGVFLKPEKIYRQNVMNQKNICIVLRDDKKEWVFL